MRIVYLLSLLLFIIVPAKAQLTLETCYEKARLNYPLIQQKELLLKSQEYSVANIRSGYYPQVSVNAQATYQSDVTRVPIENPLFKVEPLSKDQYKVYAEVNQSVYDGGAIKRNTAIQELSTRLEDQKIEIELFKIKERISQLFFGVLLINEQLVQLNLIKSDLQSSLLKVESAIKNGTAYKTSSDILQAELLKTRQRELELKSARISYLTILGLFINQPLDETSTLAKPQAVAVANITALARPEINLFNQQQQLFTAQYQLSKTRVTPKLGLFLQAGYGKPGLNMLVNQFDTYYIGGLRFNWNLSGFYNTNRDKQLLDLNIQSVTKQKETFDFNTKLVLTQQTQEIVKLDELIAIDRQLIELRSRIKTTAKSQLENGVITANDYLREMNAEDQARQNLAMHEIQLLMTQYNYLITTGN